MIQSSVTREDVMPVTASVEDAARRVRAAQRREHEKRGGCMNLISFNGSSLECRACARGIPYSTRTLDEFADEIAGKL